MRIGVLQTGEVNAALVEEFGEYPAMFERLLTPHLPEARFETWPVVTGTLPPGPEAADAWIVTGSRHGVYDALPWIEPLKARLRAIRAAGRPIVGVCFGHQILAEAFGGRADLSEKGWGAGVHRYRVETRPAWMQDAGPEIAMHAMHQDQVTAIPEDATVLAANDHCAFAMLAYGPLEAPDAISIQPHPEFTMPFARALVERRFDAIPPERATAALSSYGAPVDAEAWARWCAAYIRARLARRAAA